MVLDVLAVNTASPEYTAVIECAPCVRNGGVLEGGRFTISEATPLESGTVPRLAPKSRKTTEPVGVGNPFWPVTAAVNVTVVSVPITTGFLEVASMVVDGDMP